MEITCCITILYAQCTYIIPPRSWIGRNPPRTHAAAVLFSSHSLYTTQAYYIALTKITIYIINNNSLPLLQICIHVMTRTRSLHSHLGQKSVAAHACSIYLPTSCNLTHDCAWGACVIRHFIEFDQGQPPSALSSQGQPPINYSSTLSSHGDIWRLTTLFPYSLYTHSHQAHKH